MAILNRFNLRGRTAVITGATRGIGRAIALALAEAGADVLIHGASKRQLAQTVAAEAQKFGVRAAPSIADLADPSAPAQILSDATHHLGRIDILVLNASVQFRRIWSDYSREEFDTMVTVNLRASLELIHLAIPGMQERMWGRILTLGSVQQTRPSPVMPAYAATKVAQLSLVKSFARQLAPHGITVNNLAPGTIETDRNAEALSDPAYREKIRTMIPAARFGTPEDCAPAALLLCSDAGSYITGADYYVDGGMSL